MGGGGHIGICHMGRSYRVLPVLCFAWLPCGNEVISWFPLLGPYQGLTMIVLITLTVRLNYTAVRLNYTAIPLPPLAEFVTYEQ